MARLGDVCTVISGSTPKTNTSEYWDGDIKWITPAELNEDSFYLYDSQRHITELGKEKTGLSYMPAGTVILSSRAPIGKTAIAGCEMCCNQGFKNLICSDVIFNEYLYYFLKGKTAYLNSLGRGATFKEISKSIVENIEIRLPTLEDQKQIGRQFGEVYRLISLRKQQLAKLDELVKARFVELFGDPVYNQINWDTDAVENLCAEIYGGGTPSKAHPEYYEGGDIPWVSSKDMKTDVLYDSQIRINQLGVENSTAKMVPINSVIMVIRSGILKHTLPVAINAVPITVNQDLKVFIPNERVLPLFLMYLFKMLEKDILSGVRAVTADNIEFSSLKERKIIVPPIELQEQFATFVEQTDKSKLAVQQSLDKLETLKKSLMQKYFW